LKIEMLILLAVLFLSRAVDIFVFNEYSVSNFILFIALLIFLIVEWIRRRSNNNNGTKA
jgi:hypothetical protein